MKLRTLIAVGCAVLGCWGSAWGQIVIPPGVEPGQIQRQLQEMHAPLAAPGQVLPPTPEQPVPATASSLRFTLRAVEVSGGTVYQPQQMTAAFAPLIGREIAVTEVFRVANSLTARYR